MATFGSGLQATRWRVRFTSATRSQDQARSRGIAERAAALVALAAAAPVLSLCAVLVRVVSGRSPFVAHRRVGCHGRPFWMWKLRTMWEKGNGPGDAVLVEYLRDPFVPADKTVADPRVTHPVGRWLRRHSLDELPQLFHVVRGEMAIVGPRPLTQEELTNYYGADAAEVLTVKPGITGLWQVSGRNQLTYAQRLQFDLRFVREDSSHLYWSVLLRTIPAMLKRGGCH